MTKDFDIAVESTARLGEGPTWDAATGTLIWVDILGSAVHRWNPATGVDTAIDTPQHVGAAKPRSNGGLVLNLRDGIAIVEPSGERRWLVYWAREGVRGNDAGVDAAGRLWAGTMRYDTADGGGWLARIEPDGTATTALKQVTISNGVGWSPDNTLMYYADTATGVIDVFDYDLSSGDATSRRLFVAVDGDPDGLCVDVDGCVWSAIWGAGEVRRYTPEGRLDRTITFPAPHTSACSFGGPGLTDLYVTSARAGLTDADLAADPLSGSLFVVPDAGSGMPSTVFAG
ncbi:SMP-30/gluconolactonase/LRE family protein [Actinocrispum wychmicini]|uniref:Sugar lactone lactonase YvrE n=1 Tax=Actinocrispum wychmicini TaxID=1213861 RepID=A0A4R2JU39_9PSEU|nr:SMP-30/gluconolactonase/LRE family protein [Actinocrispum wychmicini]TCO62542.1 sugar lactone lactonase YvrE [Actinocrispum wychmicini]